jgi:chorismate mutase
MMEGKGMRGIRGAITVAQNDKQEIHEAAQQMMREILRQNELDTEVIGAVICTMTEDLTAAFPTAGIRTLPGFELVPLFDARQCAIDGSLPLCIRVLVLADIDLPQRGVRHVYLGKAANLRPDIAAADKL